MYSELIEFKRVIFLRSTIGELVCGVVLNSSPKTLVVLTAGKLFTVLHLNGILEWSISVRIFMLFVIAMKTSLVFVRIEKLKVALAKLSFLG